jgi:hypothetical protein
LAAATAVGARRIEKFCDPDSRPGRQQPRESALPRRPDFKRSPIVVFFRPLETRRLSQQQIQKVFRIVFTQRLDKLEAVAARERTENDFDPEKSRRSERVMGHVYRLLETRGRATAVDERSAAQMAAQGMRPDEIAEIAFMLDLMQRQNVAAEKQERLATLVEERSGRLSTTRRSRMCNKGYKPA